MTARMHNRLIALGLALAMALGGIAPGAAGAKKTPPAPVWPPPPEKARIRYEGTISSSDDVLPRLTVSLRKLAFGRGSAEIRLKLPYGVAVDSQGRIYVADYGQATVAVFDQAKKKAWRLGKPGALAGPVGITVGRDDTIFVTDTKLARVFKFAPDGTLLYTLGTRPGEFDRPSAVAVDREQDVLYVVDTQLHKVLKYRASDGSPLGSLGQRGVGPGAFNFPTNAWVDQKTGHLYISDTMNFRVQAFDREGRFVRAFGEPGDTPGAMARSRGVAVDTEGHVYVIDAAFNNFQIFDQKGQLLLWVGQAGIAPGEFNSPAGLFIDDRNKIYVADRMNARVQIFQFLGGS